METKSPDEVTGREGEWPAAIPQRKHDFLAKYLDEISGFDREKVLAGHVVDRILGDDDGKFGTAMLFFDVVVGRPDEAEEHKGDIIGRIDWEINQGATPENIKKLLKEVKIKLEESPWGSLEDVQAARGQWKGGVYDRVLAMVEQNQDGLGDTYQEFRKFEDELRARKLPF
jgi:hypothetical protein